MPLLIIRNDITRVKADAVVCPTDSVYSGSGGTDLAIHHACGASLRRLCDRLPRCGTGEAYATEAPNLPAKHIFHTVGPVWCGGDFGEADALRRCYRSCLALADELRLSRIAFPIISSGTFGFPKTLALQIAREELTAYLETHEAELLLVVYDQTSFEIGLDLFGAVQSYISTVLPEPSCGMLRSEAFRSSDLIRRANPSLLREEARRKAIMEYFAEPEEEEPPEEPLWDAVCFSRAPEEPDLSPFEAEAEEAAPISAAAQPVSFLPFSESELKDLAEAEDESFAHMLLRKIDEKQMTDAECYHRANIDRRLFNKIKNNPNHRPSKQTVLAFAVALRLTLTETNELLLKAGYSLSRSFKFDIVVEYCISHAMYDIFRINELLFSFDLPLLGS